MCIQDTCKSRAPVNGKKLPQSNPNVTTNYTTKRIPDEQKNAYFHTTGIILFPPLSFSLYLYIHISIYYYLEVIPNPHDIKNGKSHQPTYTGQQHRIKKSKWRQVSTFSFASNYKLSIEIPAGERIPQPYATLEENKHKQFETKNLHACATYGPYKSL